MNKDCLHSYHAAVIQYIRLMMLFRLREVKITIKHKRPHLLPTPVIAFSVFTWLFDVIQLSVNVSEFMFMGFVFVCFFSCTPCMWGYQQLDIA